MLRIAQGGEYRGETYIFCDCHETAGPDNGPGTGDIFDGSTPDSLAAFISRHLGCP